MDKEPYYTPIRTLLYIDEFDCVIVLKIIDLCLHIYRTLYY